MPPLSHQPSKLPKRAVFSAGFTLIEVLIASAIMTASMGVLLQLFSSSFSRMLRAGEIAHELLIEQQIMQELSILNPAQKTQGDRIINGHKVHWEATLKQELQVMPQTQGEFSTEKFVGLYDLTVNFSATPDHLKSMHWQQLGWK